MKKRITRVDIIRDKSGNRYISNKSLNPFLVNREFCDWGYHQGILTDTKKCREIRCNNYKILDVFRDRIYIPKKGFFLKEEENNFQRIGNIIKIILEGSNKKVDNIRLNNLLYLLDNCSFNCPEINEKITRQEYTKERDSPENKNLTKILNFLYENKEIELERWDGLKREQFLIQNQKNNSKKMLNEFEVGFVKRFAYVFADSSIRQIIKLSKKLSPWRFAEQSDIIDFSYSRQDQFLKKETGKENLYELIFKSD